MKPQSTTIMLTVKQWAFTHGKTCTAARRVLKQLRVAGAQLAGIHWLIPDGTPWPALKVLGRPKGSKKQATA